MPKYKFIFTYSVSPYGVNDIDRKTKQADKVRNKIGEIKNRDWTKLKDVETTFVGDIWLTNDETKKMRNQAEKIVKEEISEIISEYNALLDVSVYVALMIDSLGEHMEFSI